MRHIGVTGTRLGANKLQLELVEEVLKRAKAALGFTHLHHGDCVGLDRQADLVAKKLGYKTVCHPPAEKDQRAFTEGHSKIHDPLPYLVRDEQIVRAVEVLLAVPKEGTEVLRSGTWATIRRARRFHTTCMIIRPNGSMVVEDNT